MQPPTVDSTDYEVTPFENAWPVKSGVLQTTGSIRFVSPGPGFHPGNYADNEHLVVFPERSDVILEEVIRVDLEDPGDEGDKRAGFDSVILAADQRTLILDPKVAPHKLDQLRVLVEAE